MRLHVEHKDGSIQVFDFRPGRIRVGRASDCEVRFDSARYPKISSVHVEFSPNGDSWILSPRSRSNSTLLNGQPVSVSSQLSVGDRIQLGFTGPLIHVVNLESDGSAPAATLQAEESQQFLQELRSPDSFLLKAGGVIGRDPTQSSFVLDHPHVSRKHCQIIRKKEKFLLKDLGGANGTFVSGKRITVPTVLNQGDSVDIGPFLLELRGERLFVRSRKNNIQLVADQINFVVDSIGTKKPVCLLNGIDLVIDPGEFVCIMGPSGSGKSTLLRAISGRSLPSEGEIYINGRDLHQNFSALKSDLAVIPQIISLHNSLTVEQSLRYSASLRLSPDLTANELSKSVDMILETVGLADRKSVRISQLSGGQLKRVGLASELISQPSLIFLDEVTSGLDEQADLEMMQLFREFAGGGKTLVCITHNLGNVTSCCTHVAVLTKGGRLAFFGTPTAATRYFKVDRLAEIYNVLEQRTPEAWAKGFLQSTDYRQHIIERRPAVQSTVSQSTTGDESKRVSLAIWTRQFFTILARTVAVWQSDKIALATLIGQPILVAMLLCMVFGKFEDLSGTYFVQQIPTTQNLLFLLNVSCFWLGCNTSVKELVKEREVYIRERNSNLTPEAYLYAKLVFFSAIAVLQALMLGTATLAWFDPPGNAVGMLVSLSFLALSGATMGLAISSIARSEETAIAIVPMAIIPQIVLGGIVASLSGVSEWIATSLATVYWSQHLLNGSLSESVQFARDFQPPALLCVIMITMHTSVFVWTAWYGVRHASDH